MYPRQAASEEGLGGSTGFGPSLGPPTAALLLRRRAYGQGGPPRRCQEPERMTESRPPPGVPMRRAGEGGLEVGAGEEPQRTLRHGPPLPFSSLHPGPLGWLSSQRAPGPPSPGGRGAVLRSHPSAPPAPQRGKHFSSADVQTSQGGRGGRCPGTPRLHGPGPGAAPLPPARQDHGARRGRGTWTTGRTVRKRALVQGREVRPRPCGGSGTDRPLESGFKGQGHSRLLGLEPDRTCRALRTCRGPLPTPPLTQAVKVAL